MRLIGPDGLLWSPKTAVSPVGSATPPPTNNWTAEQYADSQLLIEPIPGTPPGLYTIQLLLFDEETVMPVPLTTGEDRTRLRHGAGHAPPRSGHFDRLHFDRLHFDRLSERGFETSISTPANLEWGHLVWRQLRP
ncbi:MAG: hypothetical protein M5U34_42905 [Chloroflexi bacterium]|nr:hypothetical protein [Chloroflexota bacterium]